MSNPLMPEDVKETIPSSSGNFCQKFLNALKLPALFYSWYSWMWTEDGHLTEDAAAEFCSLGCIGGGGSGGGGGDLTVPVLTASDGAFTDKVVVSWTKITGASYYILYRNDAGINDPTHSATVQIGQLSGTVWDDTNVSVNNIYFYWVKAVMASVVGAYSNGDQGTVGEPDTTITPVSGIKVSQGYSGPTVSGRGTVAIEFDAVSGADAYEFWRSTTGVFGGEEILINPESVSGTAWRRWQTPSAGPIPSRSRDVVYFPFGDVNHRPAIYGDNFFIKRNGKLCFLDDANLGYTIAGTPLVWTEEPKENVLYYYRIVPKKLGSTIKGLLADATSKTGYVGLRPTYTVLGHTLSVKQADFTGTTYTIVHDGLGLTKMRVVIRGHGGSGSGGDQSKAGAGGGAGALVAAEFAIADGEVWTINVEGGPVPNSSSHEASGADGFDIVVKKNGVEKLKAGKGGGGVYHIAAICDPGIGGVGDLHGIAVDANNEIIVGEAGYADFTSQGGLGGSSFGAGNVAGQVQGYPGAGSGGCGVEVAANPLNRRSPAPLFPIAVVSLG